MDHVDREIANRVIEHGDAHMRVLGPPGSGKTSLLIERFRRLSERAGRDDAVAVITYTRENSHRLTAALLESGSSRFGRSPVFTYHQLALHVLRGRGPRKFENGDWSGPGRGRRCRRRNNSN